jgi:hypothetical protein
MFIMKKKALLVLGSSFRRNTGKAPLSACERFDGLFFRIARKYLKIAKGVDVAVMLDDLTLVDGSTLLPYMEPEGTKWGGQLISKPLIENALEKNCKYFRLKFKNKKYDEVFLSMGKKYATTIPDLTDYGVKLIFPTNGGLGPKALALKEWLISK